MYLDEAAGEPVEYSPVQGEQEGPRVEEDVRVQRDGPGGELTPPGLIVII